MQYAAPGANEQGPEVDSGASVKGENDDEVQLDSECLYIMSLGLEVGYQRKGSPMLSPYKRPGDNSRVGHREELQRRQSSP